LREHGPHDSCDGCRCSVLSEIKLGGFMFIEARDLNEATLIA
jgi:hypothetical protein